MKPQRAFTGAPWEKQVGYCRAIRSGELAWVTGTVAVDEQGQVAAPGDPYRQAARCFEIIRHALEEIGMGIEDVVRTRMYVVDVDQWKEIGKAHREVFLNHPPATTMVQVSRLIGSEFLVEIEADAVQRT